MSSPQPNQSASVLAAQIIALFQATAPDGQRVFGKQDIRHFIPMFLYCFWDSSVGLPLPNFAARIFVEFCQQAGIGSQDPPEKMQQAIAERYQAHPVHPELLAGVRRVVNAHEATSRNDPSKQTRFKAFLGEQPGATALTTTEPPPEGSISAAAARLALDPDGNKKSSILPPAPVVRPARSTDQAQPRCFLLVK